MPIYEYQCVSCGEVFEVMQKFSDPPVKSCKLCKGKVRKLLAAPALQFKGSGFYITDYAGKNAANNSEAKPDSSAGLKTEPKAGAESASPAPSCACKSGSCGSK